MKVIIKPLIFGLACFVAGYQFSVYTQSPSVQEPLASQIDKKIISTENYDNSSSMALAEVSENKDELFTTEKNTTSLNKLKSSDSIQLQKSIVSNDLDSILTRLEDLRGEPGSGLLVATQFDALKNFLIDNPESLDELVAQLDNYSINSTSFNTVLSAIKILPPEEADHALISYAEQYVGDIDNHSSQEKFLAVLSNTSSSIKSEYIIQSLVDLATLEESNVSTKLKALDLVEPYQLQESEKEDIAEELNRLVENSNETDAAGLFSYLVKFSKKPQRTQIATNMLLQSHSETMRSQVLDSINAGSIPATDEMKAILADMANDPDDVLGREALETLEYTFELNRDEHSQLTSNVLR